MIGSLLTIAVCWVGFCALLLAGAVIYTLLDEFFHNPVDRLLSGDDLPAAEVRDLRAYRQERRASACLYRTQGRQVLATSKTAPATRATSRGLDHQGALDDRDGS